MKYQSALKEFKTFLEETNISRFCSEICKGGCCYDCESLEDCNNRLACKSYLCGELVYLLFDEKIMNREDYRDRYTTMMFKIESIIHDHIHHNGYFTPYNPSMDELDFDISLLSEIDRKETWRRIHYLIHLHNKIERRKKSLERKHGIQSTKKRADNPPTRSTEHP